ncbi:Ent-kaur-16-ene synthase, chloroplastic [Ananas comosus]|uniref:Ent-kaur-16-ene synthase, chloroplastic n=1 Tax=Ananas comosus TaxID=4615 RepID=A0A199VT57_ANACO|nr:Ent-kaur-16-ene synthase, chloroplastic [Ananas comosus]
MPLTAISFCGPLCCIQSSDIQISEVRVKQTVRASLPRVLTAYLDDEKVASSANLSVMGSRELEKRIRERLRKVEYSASSYDTAWVAMVPSPGSPQTPCFPQCVNWMLQNQNSNGSWGLDHIHPSLMKDALSSTLACVLALRRWNAGEEHIRRGLRYIGSNLSCVMDENYQSPVGFNIIFPGMLKLAIDLGLDIPIRQRAIQDILCLRDLELKRDSANISEGRKAYMAYVSEGLRNVQNWNEVMKYQGKNGSLFNSPSTTAVALTHLYDVKALDYLHAVLRRFGSSVPTVYPFEIHTQLCMVDTLEKLGISRQFTFEIRTILDRIYRCWLENDEELSSDMATCAMAFRLLRMNGFDVSSDGLSRFAEAHNFHNSLQGHLKDMKTVLEFHKASQIKISDSEQVLDKLGSLLKEKYLLIQNILPRYLQEADYVLKFPFYANLERLEHKRNIEHFDVANYQILKTSYKSFCTSDDLLKLAVEDFSSCQSIYRKELQHLQSWVRENRLDQLGFARDKLTYCYLSAAATLYSPELTDARISWAKNGVLTTVVDDFFDIGGSQEELKNLISLVENLMRSMMNEAEWLRNKTVPTIEQYMENGFVSFALGPIILPALYFVGPKLSEEAVADPECHEMFRLVSTCGRLLNDLQGYEGSRELEKRIRKRLRKVEYSASSYDTAWVAMVPSPGSPQTPCFPHWVRENRLDQLGFARDKLTYCYLSAAATLYSPELTDARISWAKNGVLTTVVDDFFDIGGSQEELKNLISLVEKWDGNHKKEFCSEHVEIVFSAIYSTINELGAKASAVQNRSVTGHLVEIWLSLMRSMMNEAEWLRNKTVPTIEQYMENGFVSFALGPIILPALYFVGPKLSEEAVADPECHEMFRLVSTCGRLLNDLQGYEREGKEGKLNSISLRLLHGGSSASIEEAKREIKRSVETSRRELLRLVLKEGTVIPRSCKDLFWKMCRILHLFYMNTDGFTSPKEMHVLDLVISRQLLTRLVGIIMKRHLHISLALVLHLFLFCGVPTASFLYTANLDDAKVANSANLSVMCSRESEKRIREQLSKVEYSVSSYDTAWVAMVPSPGSPQTPCFPQCVDWMLQNQNSNGSWGLDHIHPSLMKDALSSTLACVLALKRWNVGEEHVRRGNKKQNIYSLTLRFAQWIKKLHFFVGLIAGLRYIGSNLSCIKDENYQSPVGFNIIFPGMLERAIDLGILQTIPRDEKRTWRMYPKD